MVRHRNHEKAAAASRRYRKRLIERIGLAEFRRKNRDRSSAYVKKNRAKVYARKNAADARKSAQEKRLRGRREFIAGFCIVGKSGLIEDRTKWRGPGWRREEILEKIADELLRKGKKKK